MASEGVEQVDMVAIMEQDEKVLGGEGKQHVVTEIGDVHLEKETEGTMFFNREVAIF